MIERFVNLGVSRPVVGAVLVFLLAGFGAVAFRDLPADVFPDLSTPTFNLILQDASMAPEELEVAISVPLENSFAGLPGVRRVRSQCGLGVVQITVEFEADADYFRARQLLAERAAQVAVNFPPGVEPPLISSVAIRLNEVMELSLESDAGKSDLLAMRDLAEFDVKNRLSVIPGIATVERLGGYLKEFQILLDPARMASRHVTVNEVVHAAEEASKNGAGGFILRGDSEWTVRAIGRVTSVDELRRSVVSLRESVPILLGDVAEVREGGAVRRGIAHRTIGEVVSMRIIKQFGADTVALSENVNAIIPEIRKSLPEGVRLVLDYDQGSVVHASLMGLGKSLLLGAILVVLVVSLLLGNWRAAALVTLSIPLSIAMSGLVLQLTGSGVNAMTLGGLAIAVGLLVDAGIIVCENIFHRLNEKRPSREDKTEVVGAATREISRPIAYATLIIIAVFGPLILLTGIEGKLYRPLALGVVGAVGASLLVSVLLLPGLASIVLKAQPAGRHEDVWIIRTVKRVYSSALEWCLRHAGLVRVVTLGITVPAVFLAFGIGSDFLPRLDEGAIMVNTAVAPDASLELVDRLNHRVEDALRQFPEVKEVGRRTGRGERTEDPMQHTYSDLLVVLGDDAKRRGDDLVADMREAVKHIPGIQSSFTTPMQMRIDEGLAGTPADLSVKLFGHELDILQELGRTAETLTRSVTGIADTRLERLVGAPQIRINFDREACNRFGIETGEAAEITSQLLVGKVVSEAWVGPRRYDIVVRLSEDARKNLPALRNLRLNKPHGGTVPLEEIARIEETTGYSVIKREAMTRKLTVDASVEGRDLGSTAAELKNILDTKLVLPRGYFYSIGGRVENQAKAQRALIRAIAFAGIAVVVLLYLALDSFLETLVILGTLPDAFVGGIVALWVTGGTWNVSSLVGVIGLFGIAVQNGLVLITQAKGLIAVGVPFESAIREASVSRVRPKLLTASTAILGLLPLVLFNFRGAELEKPLAIVMIGGLITSTLFTLLALPTFYEWIHRVTGKE